MTTGSTNGSSTNVVLFERPDIHAFWTAYDPLDMAGESIDPLGFMAGYISLADRILPGFTTITHVPRYLCMLCRALQMALDTVGEIPNVTTRRRLVIEKIKLFERAWALSCGVVEAETAIGTRATENLRGIRAVRHCLDLHEGKASVTTSFSLLSNQVRYGGIGAYSAMLEALHLADMHTLSLRPSGEQLADAFQSPAEFYLDVTRDNSSLERGALLEWGRQTHAGDLSSSEARILRQALQGGEEAEFDDETRWSMLRLIKSVDPEGELDEKRLFKYSLGGIAGFKKPENKLACDRIVTALRVIEPYENLYQGALFIFNSARLLAMYQSSVDHRVILKSPGVDLACAAITSNSSRLLTEYNDSSADRSSLGAAWQSLQKIGLVELAKTFQSAKGEEALVKEVIARHLRVQEGKFDGGMPKGPWIRYEPGGTSHFALTAQKFGIAQSEFPKTWQSIEWHPYRTWAARRFVRHCKIA
jgi:hypothetical protein